MEDIGIPGLLLIITTVLFTYKGFKEFAFFEGHHFHVDSILIHKEYKRLVSSGFLHVSWVHLIFNMLTLHAFYEGLEFHVGIFRFFIIYFASLIGGNLLALYIHRNHGDYSAVGASGAVSGVIFASIALFPGMEIGFFGILYLPSWLYAIVFVLYSIYGIKSQRDNIGHEAHLGGALIGLMTAVLIDKSALSNNIFPIMATAIPTLIFLYVIVTKPHTLLVSGGTFFPSMSGGQKFQTIEDKYNAQKRDKQLGIDRILEKIHQRGIESLSAEERKILDEYSSKK